MDELTHSRRSFLSGAAASAALLALESIVRRHGGAEASPVLLRPDDAAVGPSGEPAALWRNWSGNLSSRPSAVFRPRGRDDLIDVVHRARRDGRRLRVTGSSHSFSPLVPTNEYLVYSGDMRGASVDTSDPARPRLTVETGATGKDALDAMSPRGVALPTNVVLKSVTYGGLIAAGCHGSGWDNPTLSDLVESIDIIDASGTVRTFSEAAVGAEVMQAARLNLGLFGIIDRMTLRAEPASRVRSVDRMDLTMAEVLDNLDDIVAAHDYVDLFWWPFNERLWLKTYDRTDEPITLRPGQLARESLTDFFTVRSGVAFYDWLVRHPQATPDTSRLLFSLLKGRDVVEPISNAIHYQDFIELLKVANTEFAVPVTHDLSNARRAWQMVVDITDALAAQGQYPFNLTLNARFVRNSEALLSPAYGNEHTCFIEILSYYSTPGWRRFSAAVAREWMTIEGARPHWPKEFQQIPGIGPFVRGSLGPRLARFLEIRDSLGVDPDRMFVNPSLERLLFV